MVETYSNIIGLLPCRSGALVSGLIHSNNFDTWTEKNNSSNTFLRNFPLSAVSHSRPVFAIGHEDNVISSSRVPFPFEGFESICFDRSAPDRPSVPDLQPVPVSRVSCRVSLKPAPICLDSLAVHLPNPLDFAYRDNVVAVPLVCR